MELPAHDGWVMKVVQRQNLYARVSSANTDDLIDYVAPDNKISVFDHDNYYFDVIYTRANSKVLR